MNRADDTRATWYFDVVSPFAYLQWHAIRDLAEPAIAYRPILFAALLKHHAHKGPAELEGKRRFTYRHAQWRADKAGLPMRFPPAHPFNPLAALRLCIAAGCTREAVDAVFDHLWRDGQRGDDAGSLQPVGDRLGIPDVAAAIARPDHKATLARHTDEALARGVFGVPSLVVDGQVFWGEDATGMFLDYLADPALFQSPVMQRLDALPVGAVRKGPA